MSDYRAPIKDMRFVMDEIAGFQQLSQLPAYADATPDMADAILDEAAKFTREVLAPLNRVGDTQGCTWTPEGVTTPDGWKEAYNAFREAGWSGITLPTEYGGQGLPSALGIAVRKGSAQSRTTLVRGERSALQLRLGVAAPLQRPRLDLVFLVDATGSMGDEIAKLKTSMRAMSSSSVSSCSQSTPENCGE